MSEFDFFNDEEYWLQEMEAEADEEYLTEQDDLRNN